MGSTILRTSSSKSKQSMQPPPPPYSACMIFFIQNGLINSDLIVFSLYMTNSNQYLHLYIVLNSCCSNKKILACILNKHQVHRSLSIMIKIWNLKFTLGFLGSNLNSAFLRTPFKLYRKWKIVILIPVFLSTKRYQNI